MTWFPPPPTPSHVYSFAEAQTPEAIASEHVAVYGERMFFIESGYLFTTTSGAVTASYMEPSTNVKSVVIVGGTPAILQDNGEVFLLQQVSPNEFHWYRMGREITKLAVEGDTLYALTDSGDVWSMPGLKDLTFVPDYKICGDPCIEFNTVPSAFFTDTGLRDVADFIFDGQWKMLRPDQTLQPF